RVLGPAPARRRRLRRRRAARHLGDRGRGGAAARAGPRALPDARVGPGRRPRRPVMSRVRGVLRAVLSVEDRPSRVALAFAIGVFIAFFPLLGIHTGLALAIAFYFRLNRVAILAGAWINNPWTLAPMFMAGTVVGCAIFGVSTDDLPGINSHLHRPALYHAPLHRLRPHLRPLL